jgi:hypothetical protein
VTNPAASLFDGHLEVQAHSAVLMIVRFWRKADVGLIGANDRFWGKADIRRKPIRGAGGREIVT